MILYTQCPSCGDRASKRTFAEGRTEVIKAMGENPTLKCSDCKHVFKVSVDELSLKSDSVLIYAGMFLGILLALLTHMIVNYSVVDYVIPYFAIIAGYLAPILVAQYASMAENRKIKKFRSDVVRRKKRRNALPK